MLMHTEYAHLYKVIYTIYMPTKHETIHSAIISHEYTNSRPLWLNSDGHFDFMLISSRRILITHMALGSPYLETYV